MTAATNRSENGPGQLVPVSKKALDGPGPWSVGWPMRLAGKQTDGKPGEVLAKLELERNSVPDADGIATQAGWIQKAPLMAVR